jgi:hypothetical protein
MIGFYPYCMDGFEAWRQRVALTKRPHQFAVSA